MFCGEVAINNQQLHCIKELVNNLQADSISVCFLKSLSQLSVYKLNNLLLAKLRTLHGKN